MGVLQRVATTVEARLSRAFGGLGWWVAGYPFITIAGCIVLAAILASGIPSIKSISDAPSLYAPAGNRGQKDLDKMEELFESVEPAQLENFLIVYSEDGRNLYTAEVLNSLYAMFQDLKALEVPYRPTHPLCAVRH